MFDFTVAGHVVPIFLLVLTGFTVGVVGGFIGVGGGYMVTPALIVFGFPGYMASGTDACHIAGKVRHLFHPPQAIGQHRLGHRTLHGGRHHAGRRAGRAAAGLHQEHRPFRRRAAGGLGRRDARPLHLHPDRDPEVPQEARRGPGGRQGNRPRSESEHAAPFLSDASPSCRSSRPRRRAWSSPCGSS